MQDVPVLPPALMRVRLLIRDEIRFVELPFVPRIGEIIESAAFGRCEVVNVIYSPDSPEHPVTLVLRKSG